MEQPPNLYGLNQCLFWDIDPGNFDIDRNAAWIIQRVLEYGTMKDWKIIEDHFGIDGIVLYAQHFRTLDPVSLSFLCFILSFRTIVPHTLEHIDIAAKKLYAISRRGSKKDFIDLYFLLQHYTLEEILGFYVRKYPQYSIFRVRMSLTYFEDTENQENPKLFENVDWKWLRTPLQKQSEKWIGTNSLKTKQ